MKRDDYGIPYDKFPKMKQADIDRIQREELKKQEKQEKKWEQQWISLGQPDWEQYD